MEHIHNQCVWFNSHIKIDNHIIFNKRLYHKDVIYVHQFFNEQGEILSQDNFQYQYNVNINYLDYYSIISAFPQHWKRVLRDKHNNNNNDTTKVQHTPLLALIQKTTCL